jgi:hypothetical protein
LEWQNSYAAEIPARIGNLVRRFIELFGADVSPQQRDLLDLILLRLEYPDQETFERSMLEVEEQWLRRPGTGRALMNIRHRLELFLAFHVRIFERDYSLMSDAQRYEKLERMHRLIELLKGQVFLHRFARPGQPTFDKYAARLPTTLDSPIVSLAQVCHSLRHCGAAQPVGINMCYLRDPLGLGDPAIISIVATAAGVRLLVHQDSRGRGRENLREALSKLDWLHSVVNASPKRREAALGRILTSGVNNIGNNRIDKESYHAAVLREANTALQSAFDSFCRPVIPSNELRGCTVWISPSPELYGVPIALLQCGGQRLSDIAAALITVPIFSLGQYRSTHSHEGAQVVYGEKRWVRCARENGFIGSPVPVGIYPADGATGFPFDPGGQPSDVYPLLEESLRDKTIAHIVTHHDVESWVPLAAKPKNRSNTVGKWAQRLLAEAISLDVDLLVLESCEARRPLAEDGLNILGLWVAFLLGRANTVIASPYSVWPLRPGMDAFFKSFYRDLRPNDVVHVAQQLVACQASLRRLAMESGDLALMFPTYWGAFDIVSTLPLRTFDTRQTSA